MQCSRLYVSCDLLEPGDGVRGGHVLDSQLAAEAHVTADLEAVVAGLAGDHAGGLGHHPLHPLHPDAVLDGAPLVAHSAGVLTIIRLSVVLNKIFTPNYSLDSISFTVKKTLIIPNLNDEFAVPVYPDGGVEAAVPASLLQGQPVLGPGYLGPGAAWVIGAEQLYPVTKNCYKDPSSAISCFR